jgi:hypothetical protein
MFYFTLFDSPENYKDFIDKDVLDANKTFDNSSNLFKFYNFIIRNTSFYLKSSASSSDSRFKSNSTSNLDATNRLNNHQYSSVGELVYNYVIAVLLYFFETIHQTTHNFNTFCCDFYANRTNNFSFEYKIFLSLSLILIFIIFITVVVGYLFKDRLEELRKYQGKITFK